MNPKLTRWSPVVQQREAKLVNEWLMTFHPNALQWRRVRLGPLPKKELASLYKVTLRWVDAIFKEGDKIYLVEAKLKPTPSAIGQLKLYKELFYQTPEFSEFHNLPVEMILLTTREDPHVKNLCIQEGINYVVYKPSWLE